MTNKELTPEQILKRRAAQKRHYQNPKVREKKLAYCKKRYEEKPTEILAQQANYRAENRDAINARERARYRANKVAILRSDNL